ncbi:putative type III effector Hop protein [Cupriavidus sp. U2]|uniref:four-carbon acid sugar kinase family protein n=1 Tax=Cupriavidus sp. U2 TaxID=2920269 RepID=UPI00129E91F9|nr:four-carbon acid sugar kinase family protein [Cupriavidus sp. U2]KAI3590008.1 putative type III effector Hop protein [Cupriavidus sp. U2]
MSWLIIADDLSGAADCAIGFAAHGARTVVTLDAAAAVEVGGADVVAADVDSRRLAPTEAAARNLEAWRCGTAAHRRLYKKIDSTLRGNWAAETAALQPVAGLAVVAPAFPAMGRTTRDGRMFVNGQPLESTDIWRLEGLTGPADMVALLEAQGLRTARISLYTLRAGLAAVQSQLAGWQAEGYQAVVCDAEIEADLLTLAQASIDLATPVFWVGSGGLARALSAAAPVRGVDTPTPAPRHEGPVLTLVGSMSGVSGRQATYLCEQAGIDALVVPPQALRDGAHHAAWIASQQSIADCLMAGRDLLVSIGRDDAFDPAEGPQLSAALAQLVLPYFAHVGGLIATGGETARAMLAAAGIGALTLKREVEAGVPLSETLTGPTRRIATKAGAFGTDAALWLAWQAMRQD